MGQTNIILTTETYVVTTTSSRTVRSKSIVYISNALATANDQRLRELFAAKEQLGDRRFALRGTDDMVDRLYDTVNRNIARVKRRLALEAVRQLPGYTNITGNFSRYAGCSCGCSPGVVLSDAVYANNYMIDLWMNVRTPTAES